MNTHVYLATTFSVLCLSLSISFAQPIYQLSGQVYASGSAKLLESVRISLGEVHPYYYTDQSGNFNLQLPEGTYRIGFSREGFQQRICEIILNENTELSVSLENMNINLPAFSIDNQQINKKNPKSSALESMVRQLEEIFFHKIWH